MNATRTVACPKCGAPVVWTEAAKWRPFCSERCRTIDQGAWASGTYRVPAVDRPDEAESPLPPDDS